MKISTLLMAILSIALVAGCKSGSGATTEPSGAQALATAIGITDSAIVAVTAAYASGLISQADVQKLMPKLNAIANAEIAAQKAYAAGDSATGDARYADAMAAEAAFNSALQSIENPTSTPTPGGSQ